MMIDDRKMKMVASFLSENKEYDVAFNPHKIYEGKPYIYLYQEALIDEKKREEFDISWTTIKKIIGEFHSIDDLLSKLDELSSSKKFKIGQTVYYLNQFGEIESFIVEKIERNKLYFGVAFVDKYRAFPSRLELINEQINYWNGMKELEINP